MQQPGVWRGQAFAVPAPCSRAPLPGQVTACSPAWSWGRSPRVTVHLTSIISKMLSGSRLPFPTFLTHVTTPSLVTDTSRLAREQASSWRVASTTCRQPICGGREVCAPRSCPLACWQGYQWQAEAPTRAARSQLPLRLLCLLTSTQKGAGCFYHRPLGKGVGVGGHRLCSRGVWGRKSYVWPPDAPLTAVVHPDGLRRDQFESEPSTGRLLGPKHPRSHALQATR